MNFIVVFPSNRLIKGGLLEKHAVLSLVYFQDTLIKIKIKIKKTFVGINSQAQENTNITADDDALTRMAHVSSLFLVTTVVSVPCSRLFPVSKGGEEEGLHTKERCQRGTWSSRPKTKGQETSGFS